MAESEVGGGLSMPGPGASNDEITQYLFSQHEEEKRRQLCFNQENNTIQQSFVNMAVSIAVAFLVEVFFKRNVGYAIFGALPDQYLASQDLVMNLLWFAVVWTHFPLSRLYLSNVVVEGSRARSFWEDCLVLWKMATRTMLLWAFKDLVLAVQHLLFTHWKGCNTYHEETAPCNTYLPNNPDDYWFNRYTDSDDVGWVLKFGVVNLATVVFALVVAVLGVVVLQLIFNCGRGANDGLFNSVRHGDPFLLGIGLAEAEVFSWLWFWFPQSAVESDVNIGFYGLCAKLMSTIVTSLVSVVGLKYNIYRKKRVKASGGVLWTNQNNIDVRWIFGCAADLLLRALPFAFAWEYTQLFYEIYWHCFFDCGYPYRGCNHSSALLWILYATLYTLAANALVPVLRTSRYMLNRLDQFYTQSLLRSDKLELRREAVRDDLIISLFGIGAGWAYTEVIREECYVNISHTCPKNVTGETVLLYAGTVVVFLLLFSLGYHAMVRSLRLRARAAKVEAIEVGYSRLIFSEIDQDGDGVVGSDTTKILDLGRSSQLYLSYQMHLDFKRRYSP